MQITEDEAKKYTADQKDSYERGGKREAKQWKRSGNLPTGSNLIGKEQGVTTRN